MKLAIFGGTGYVGQALVRMALDRGHDLRLLVRNPRKFDSSGSAVEVVAGDALDIAAVTRTIAGCAAVLSTLGGYHGTPSLDEGTASILAAMRASNIHRLVAMQGIHVPFPGDPNNLGKHIVSAFLTVRSPSLVRRSRALGFMLQGTHDIDWTLIRVPRVVDGSPTQAAQTGSLRLGPSSSVTRGDVVALMLDALENRSLVHASPMVSSPRRSARRSPESSAPNRSAGQRSSL
jgi:putative NADH-flavin reductase